MRVTLLQHHPLPRQMWRYILVGHKIEKIRAIQEGRLEEAKASVAQSKAQARKISSPIDEEPLFQKVPFKPFLEA